MRIFLVGIMGSGKSTMGKQLANSLNYRFIDLDEEIENLYSKSVQDIFSQEGEDKFREYERNTLHEVSSLEDVIIAAGGGTPCFFDNIDFMNKMGTTIYLNVDIPVLVERLKASDSIRPLILNKEDEELADYLDELLTVRDKFYRQSKYTIDANDVNVDKLMSVVQKA